jgi:hypothetical protein
MLVLLIAVKRVEESHFYGHQKILSTSCSAKLIPSVNEITEDQCRSKNIITPKQRMHHEMYIMSKKFQNESYRS